MVLVQVPLLEGGLLEMLTNAMPGMALSLSRRTGFLPASLVIVGPEKDDGVSFKTEVFIKGIADLLRDEKGTDDEDLSDDELGNGERFTEPGGAGLTGVGKALVLQDEYGFETRKHEGGVNAVKYGHDEDQDQEEEEYTRLPEQVEMKVRRG